MASYDDLVKTLATHQILLQTPAFQSPPPPPPPPPPPNLYPFSPYLDPHLSIHQLIPKIDTFLHQPPQNTQPFLLHSLLRRIAALESSFPHPLPEQQKHRASHWHRTSHQHPIPAAVSSSSTSLRTSLRDMAARTIQAAFRRFLVRRSRTLRDLKELAAIESHVAALHSAVSDKGSHEAKALSERAMCLLMRLDSIKSAEPMIRHGKRSISRELVRMLEFIDKVLVKEYRRSLEAPDLDENVVDRRELMDDLSRGTKANEKNAKAARKKVTFSENGKSSGFSFDRGEPSTEELNDADEKILGREFSGIRIKDHLVCERVHQVGDGDSSSEDSLMDNGGVHLKGRTGDSGLAAPLPLQMEPRRTPF